MAVRESPVILKAKESDRPALKDLNNFVVPYVGKKWFNLGVQLYDEQDQSKLHNLKAEQKDMEELCTDMFIYWLASYPKASWAEVISALKTPSVNLQNLAYDIDNKLQRNIWSRGVRKIKEIWKGPPSTIDEHGVATSGTDDSGGNDEPHEVQYDYQHPLRRHCSTESLPTDLYDTRMLSCKGSLKPPRDKPRQNVKKSKSQNSSLDSEIDDLADKLQSQLVTSLNQVVKEMKTKLANIAFSSNTENEPAASLQEKEIMIAEKSEEINSLSKMLEQTAKDLQESKTVIAQKSKEIDSLKKKIEQNTKKMSQKLPETEPNQRWSKATDVPIVNGASKIEHQEERLVSIESNPISHQRPPVLQRQKPPVSQKPPVHQRPSVRQRQTSSQPKGPPPLQPSVTKMMSQKQKGTDVSTACTVNENKHQKKQSVSTKSSGQRPPVPKKPPWLAARKNQ